MNDLEVIVVDGIPQKYYDSIFRQALEYALVSLPFTIDRMHLKNIERQVSNITKGKLAEGLLRFFFTQNDLPADFDRCQTPFYQIDKRDFLFDGFEWDFKNNFIYHPQNRLPEKAYSDLPALVPNRYAGDQWGKRLKRFFPESKGVRFLFSFLKGADLNNGRRVNAFFSLRLVPEQIKLLSELCLKYAGCSCEAQPFSKDSFIKYFKGMAALHNTFFIRSRPALIVTGYAGKRQWPLFKNTLHQDFLKGTLKTRINNATCSLKNLPSFYSLIAGKRTEFKYAHLKKAPPV